MRDESLETYLESIRDAAVSTLGEHVLGVYTTGSVALDAFVPGRSDVDMIVVAEDSTPEAACLDFAEAVSHPRLPCPATGLELSVVRRSAAASTQLVAGYLLEVNAGPELPDLLRVDPDRPAHWYVIDRAIARQSGHALLGPHPAALLTAVPHSVALDALAQSLEFQREHLGLWLNDSTVLNACRALSFVAHDTWSSKPAAGGWARGLPGIDRELIDLALDSHAHHGRAGAARIPLERSRAFVDSALTGILAGR